MKTSFATVPHLAESICANVLNDLKESRCVVIALHNLTRSTTLEHPEIYLVSGTSLEPGPIPVIECNQPHNKCVGICAFQKKGFLTGTCGLLSYKIRHQPLRLVIAWQIPYDYNLYENWFYAWIYPEETKLNNKLYEVMREQGASELLSLKDVKGFDLTGEMKDESRTILKLYLTEKNQSPKIESVQIDPKSDLNLVDENTNEFVTLAITTEQANLLHQIPKSTPNNAMAALILKTKDGKTLIISETSAIRTNTPQWNHRLSKAVPKEVLSSELQLECSVYHKEGDLVHERYFIGSNSIPIKFETKKLDMKLPLQNEKVPSGEIMISLSILSNEEAILEELNEECLPGKFAYKTFSNRIATMEWCSLASPHIDVISITDKVTQKKPEVCVYYKRKIPKMESIGKEMRILLVNEFGDKSCVFDSTTDAKNGFTWQVDFKSISKVLVEIDNQSYVTLDGTQFAKQ